MDYVILLLKFLLFSSISDLISAIKWVLIPILQPPLVEVIVGDVANISCVTFSVISEDYEWKYQTLFLFHEK